MNQIIMPRHVLKIWIEFRIKSMRCQSKTDYSDDKRLNNSEYELKQRSISNNAKAATTGEALERENIEYILKHHLGRRNTSLCPAFRLGNLGVCLATQSVADKVASFYYFSKIHSSFNAHAMEHVKNILC